MQRFFKKPIAALGVRTPDIRKIMKKTNPEGLSKQELIRVCEELLEMKKYEYAVVAFGWVYLARFKFNKKDFSIFERWLHKHVTNWGLCDTLSPYLLNDFLVRYPELMQNVRRWTRSKNNMVRRASAVVFLRDSGGVKPTLNDLKDVFWVASALLGDEDDLVQKGCGWLLKNTSIKHQKEVFEFVMQHKHRIKRTALRYAIERMPQELKVKALSK